MATIARWPAASMMMAFLRFQRKIPQTGGLSTGAIQSARPMKALRRSLYAWVALLGIVFSQLAVSAYACPGLNPLSSSQNTAKAVTGNAMAGMPCAGTGMADVDMEQPALCLQHCDQGNQTVASAQALDFHPALVLFLIVPTPAQTADASEALVQAPPLRRSTYPPPLWRTGRLRI